MGYARFMATDTGRGLRIAAGTALIAIGLLRVRGVGRSSPLPAWCPCWRGPSTFACSRRDCGRRSRGAMSGETVRNRATRVDEWTQ